MTLRKCLAIAACAALPAAAQDNPMARRTAADIVSLGGYWNGANLENRSNCATAGVNGNHGTYAQYFFSVSPPAPPGTSGFLLIHEETLSNLTCDYSGDYQEGRPVPSWTGTFSCGDGKRGTFQSTNFLITRNEMQVRLAIKLTSAEGCDIDSILGGSRF